MSKTVDADHLVEKVEALYCEHCVSYNGLFCRTCQIGNIKEIVEEMSEKLPD